MATLTTDQMTLLLANAIKQYGKSNTLKLDDQELQPPLAIGLHPGAGYAILVLLEGDNVQKWDKINKEAHEISEREGEPEQQDEQPSVLGAGSGEDSVRSPASGPSDS